MGEDFYVLLLKKWNCGINISNMQQHYSCSAEYKFPHTLDTIKIWHENNKTPFKSTLGFKFKISHKSSTGST